MYERAVEVIARLDELAATQRFHASHANNISAWEARVRAAEDLERRAANLRLAIRQRPGRLPSDEETAVASHGARTAPIPQAGRRQRYYAPTVRGFGASAFTRSSTAS